MDGWMGELVAAGIDEGWRREEWRGEGVGEWMGVGEVRHEGRG